MFLNSSVIFPFAINSENTASRSVLFTDRENLEVKFDMSLKNSPECAAVAVIYDTPKHFNELKFKITPQGEPLNITVELKTYINGVLTKFAEKEVSKDGYVDFSNTAIKRDIKEIVFCCWRANNKGKKGIVRIKGYY